MRAGVCAGGDLHALEGFTDEGAAQRYVEEAGKAAAAIFHSKKPYVAEVAGAAAGAGFNLALACDFVVASKKAKELMMLPRTLTAEEAREIGVVLRVEEPENLTGAALAFAGELAARPPLALAETKRLVNGCSAFDFDTIMREEEAVQARLAVGADAKEGISAFFEKRRPVFHGKS